MVEKVVDAQSLVAEKLLAGLLPVYDVRVAQHAHRVVAAYLQQHVQAFGRHLSQVTLPGGHNVGVGCVVVSCGASHLAAKSCHIGFAPFQLLQHAALLVGAQHVLHVEAQALKGLHAACTVKVNQHAAEVKE